MNLKLYCLFTDNMVLQQKEPICFHGWAAPGMPLTIRLASQTGEGVANADGCWKVALAPLAASGPFDVVVSSGAEVISLRNVMIGEVWVCSGQSNMEWTLGQGAGSEEVIAEAAAHPEIRLIKLPRIADPVVSQEIDARWAVCSPESVSDFSAVAYHFGLRLQQELGVAIGLIDIARGGTIVESWTPRETLLADDEMRPIVKAYEESLPRFDELMSRHEAAVKVWRQTMPPADPGNTGYAAGWANPELDDSSWPLMTIPCWWHRGNNDFSGVLWFRTEVVVPAELAGSNLTLSLGACDKSDNTYFNNVEVGGIPPQVEDSWRTPRVYTVPGRLVRGGRNVIAVRVFSNINDGGIVGPKDLMKLEAAGWSLPLAGNWRYQVEHNFGKVRVPQAPFGRGNFDSPYILFNSLVARVTCFKIRGAIWYQGESNEYNAVRYRRLFPAMIRGWRKAWNQEFPFLFVQLPNFGPELPAQTLWTELRDAQTAALTEPRVGMVPTVDIGDPADLHPANKPEVGRRLFLAALAVAYGRKSSGLLAPLFETLEVRGDELRVSVVNAPEGLCQKGGQPVGFEVAGADGRFTPARARLEGSKIVIWNEAVPAPTAVRYAWADNPRCNVFNAGGLPLAPFRASIVQTKPDACQNQAPRD